MSITSKSLQRSNVAFVFKQEGFVVPENGEFTILYTGELAKGANFIDDPVMRAKVYYLPKLKMTFTLEGTRFRIDQDPEDGNLNSAIISESLNAYRSLFSKCNLESYGFNFDIIYRFDNTLQLNYLFGLIADSSKILNKRDLAALGVQFTLQRFDRSETYFLKIVSPLELVAHINYHYNSNQLPAGRAGGPDEQKMKELFQKNYEEADEVVGNLKF